MSEHTCAPPGDSADDILNVAFDLRCAGCVDLLVSMHGPMLPASAFDPPRTCRQCRDATERETVAAIVKWLRREAAKHNGPMPGVDPVGSVRVIADAIERGDWREEEARMGSDEEMREVYMVQCVAASGSVFVKALDFFRRQGGFEQEWGKSWQPVVAESIEDARRVGCDLFPAARPYHMQGAR